VLIIGFILMPGESIKMFKKLLLNVLSTLCLLFFSSLINAAELRGRLTGIAGASVAVECSGFGPLASSIAGSGAYAVMSLPAGKDCSFRVSKGAASSTGIAFNTSQSVTIYNGQLRMYEDRIVVIRQ